PVGNQTVMRSARAFLYNPSTARLDGFAKFEVLRRTPHNTQVTFISGWAQVPRRVSKSSGRVAMKKPSDNSKPAGCTSSSRVVG
ncbi:uncharacterized protein METZ01_LOCUS508544, partial [marine metagenome]